MNRRGFSRMDLLATLVVGFIAGVLVPLPGTSAVRRAKDALRCQEQQRALAEAIFAFGSDRNGQLPMVPWHEPGAYGRGDRSWVTHPLDDALRYSRAWVSDELAKVTGERPDEMPHGWLPQATHWYVPLLGYAEPSELLELVVCPAALETGQSVVDSRRGRESRETPMGHGPVGFADNALDFRSTYEIVPSTYARTTQRTGEAYPMEQGDGLFSYRVPEQGAFRPMSDPSHTNLSSSKVLLFDPLDRHSDGGVRPYSAPDASPLVTFMDGSVRRLDMSQMSGSMEPNWLGDPQEYEWVVPTRNADNPMGQWAKKVERYPALFRWTSGGVRGSDVGVPNDRWRPDRWLSDVPFRTLRVGSSDLDR